MRLPPPLHRWSLAPQRAVCLQRRLAERIRLTPPTGPLRWIAGLDAAFADEGRTCIAGVVLWDRETGAVLERCFARRPVRFPYVPGLLSFREAPALLAALRGLTRRPDVLMCDGQGRAHPRRFGLACHLGLWSGIPSLGCAKTLLVGEHASLGEARGATAALIHQGERIGDALRTRAGGRPVFVSPGHLLDVDSATALVLACTTHHRLPEPTYLADRWVAESKRAGPLPARRRRQVGPAAGIPGNGTVPGRLDRRVR